MNIFCYSIAHEKSNVALREKISLDKHDSIQVSEALLAGGVTETLILSTCNRTEIYAVTKGDNKPNFAYYLADITNTNEELLESVTMLYAGVEVIEHLFMLACGLKSMIIGESEILGQLKKAYADALAQNSTGNILNKAFQKTFTVAKHIRSGTEIGNFRVSVASIAVEEIVKIRKNIKDLNIYIWGTGEVGKTAVKVLDKLGAKPGIILSRNPEKNHSEVPGWITISSKGFKKVLEDADIFISCTGATHQVIYPKHLRDVSKHILLVDLAVPRDISPEVAALPQVSLIDMDSIGKIAQNNRNTRELLKLEVSPIIKKEASNFYKCLLANNSQSCIAKWRQEAHEVLAREIETLLAEGNDLPPEFKEKFYKLGRRLMHRMLHWPSVCLNKAITQNLPCADFFKEIEDEIKLDFNKEELYNSDNSDEINSK